MRSCKAECRIFWNGLRIYCSFILLWVHLYCLDLCGFLSLHSLSLRPCQETHPGISVSGGKLWFAWSFAGNASSVDEKKSCASRQPVLKTWQLTQSWRPGFVVGLLNVCVSVWNVMIQHDSSSTKSMRWQRKIERCSDMSRCSGSDVDLYSCKLATEPMHILLHPAFLSQTQFLDASRMQNYL